MKKALAILMALAMLLAGSALAEAASAGQRTLRVQGVGVVTVDADRATVSLGVREVAPDVKRAQGTVNEKMDAIIAALREAGIEDGAISSSGIGVYANYSYDDNGDETISSYTAYNTLSLVVNDPDNVGMYIDIAFEAGANSLDYVDFSAANTAEAGEQALRLAVESAGKKAAVLADAAGVKLGTIVEIVDNADLTYYDERNAYAVTKDAGMGAGTQVLPSRQQVTATVTITFAIEG